MRTFRFLLCVIEIYSKYALVISLKDKKGITITNAFQKTLHKSNRKPNKMWVDKGSKFYNRWMKSWLQKNAIEMYSTHKEEKPVVAERFIRTLKNKTYKYMTSISKNIYIDKLDDIVNKYNNTYHSTLKMKKILSLKLVILLEYQNIKIFLKKVTVQIGLKKFLWLKKVKNTVPWTCLINDLNGEEIVGTFYKKEFRIKKLIKRKCDKLYVKWKGYNNSFNS